MRRRSISPPLLLFFIVLGQSFGVLSNHQQQQQQAKSLSSPLVALLAPSPPLPTRVTTLSVAQSQIKRVLFGLGSSPKPWRLLNIIVSWILLLIAKGVALLSPLYFKKLIDKGYHVNRLVGQQTIPLQASVFGVVMGMGLSRVCSGLIQMISELTLSPVTTNAAEVLPSEAFAAALKSASRRRDGGITEELKSKNNKSVLSGAMAAAGGQDEGQSGFARRALDRGLKASNQFLYRAIFNLLPSFVESLCVLYLIFVKAGKVVGLTAGFVSGLFVLVTTAVMSARIPIQREQLKCEGRANGCAEDALSLAETVFAFGAGSLETARYSHALSDVSILGCGGAAVAYASWVSAASKTMSSTSPASYAGQLVLVQSLFAQLCAPLDHVGQHFRDCVSAAEDLRELELLKRISTDEMQNQALVTPVTAPNPLLLLRRNSKNEWLSKQIPRLHLSDISFYYSSGSSGSEHVNTEPILKNVSLTIPSGGYSVGIVGPSGSGKSTLLRVLIGLEQLNSNISLSSRSSEVLISSDDADRKEDEQSDDIEGLLHGNGQIFVDGVDVSDTERTVCFAVVGQENDLFRSLNLVENIKYGTHSVLDGIPEEDSDEAKIALSNAATDAQLVPMVNKLQGGWSAAVGPRGRYLSGGERQRLCIARALYREELSRGILIMDEATSSLDAQAEGAVTRAIMKRVEAGSTAILIAHRLSSVQFCNTIIVMKDGVIVERGRHEELLRLNGWYAEAWALQQAKLT